MASAPFKRDSATPLEDIVLFSSLNVGLLTDAVHDISLDIVVGQFLAG